MATSNSVRPKPVRLPERRPSGHAGQVTRRVGRRLAALALIGLSNALGAMGCTRDDCEAKLACPSSSAGADSDGAAGGRRNEASGGRAAGSLGGGSQVDGSGGSAGEGPGWGGEESGGTGGMMVAPEPQAPKIVSVTLGGREVAAGTTTLGIERAPVIVVEFSEAMDKAATQAAYASANAPIKNSNVTFTWNSDSTALTITPSEPLDYPDVDGLAELSPLLEFRVTTAARSRAGLELTKDFSAAFSLLRRVTLQVLPDGNNSVFSIDPNATDPARLAYGVLPWYSAPWFYCGDGLDLFTGENELEDIGYSATSGYQLEVGRTANLGDRNIGVMSFPLTDLSFVELEAATLELVKWRQANGDTTSWDLDALEDFSVDALASQPLSLATLIAPSLRSNLPTVDGETFPKGYGVFEFDVTSLLDQAFEAGDRWAMYRVEFDRADEWDDSYEQHRVMCASLALTLVFLTE